MKARTLTIQLRNDLNSDSDEILWISTNIKSKKFVIAIVYKPQYLTLSSLENSLQKAHQISSNVLLIGDFNINLLNENTDSRCLLELCKNYGFSQYINGPTRSDDNSESLIDHLWATETIKPSAGKAAGISDHAGIYAVLPDVEAVPKTKPIIGRSFKHYDATKAQADFVNSIQVTDFDLEIMNGNVNRASEILSGTIAEVCNRFAPEKEFHSRGKTQIPPWFTPELISLIEEKQEALCYHRFYQTGASRASLKLLTSKIKSLKRSLKKEHFASQIEKHKNNSKKLWQLLKEATRSQVPDTNIEPDDITKTKANMFNNFFSTIGRKTLQKLNLSETPFTPTSTEGYIFEPTTPSEVEDLISRMKTNTATGYDKIPARILIDLRPVISIPLSNLINISFQKSIFPSNMKHALVRPIFKNKGHADDPQYYRPISVLTALSKIVERAAVNRLVKHLEETNKLYNSQHAYRQSHSTTTALVEITEFFHQELEKRNIPAIVATDLSKAFDSVSHGLLLQKLQDLGLHRMSTTWIGSYLSERTQSTKFSSVTSDEDRVLAGVPQGSILGPILFIAFTADLAREMDGCKVVAYADDAALLISATSWKQLKHKIETNVKNAQSWYTKNGLLINSEKTEFMVVKQRGIFEINISNGAQDVVIKSKDCLKVLGMKVDSSLTWRNHISQIKSRTTNAIRNIARTNFVLPLESRLLLTNALVVPHYNYGDIIYDGCTADARDALERNQNYAAKAILGRSKFSSSTNALKEIGWIPLCERRKIHQGVFVHKAIHKKNSLHATSAILNLLPRHNHSTRHRQGTQFNSQQHHSSLTEKSVIYRSTRAWNSFPKDVCDIDSTKGFKDRLQKYLITNHQYDDCRVGGKK